MEGVAALTAKYFSGSGAELRMGGLSVRALAERYGTPLFLYDRAVLDAKWNQLRGALPARFSISYSVKANPNRAFLEYFLEKGAGLEIASGGEFHQALAAGCPAERILFAGPGKTEAELEFVLARNIGEIHIESLREAERIIAISRKLGKSARVAIRVNPAAEVQGGAMRMGGKPAPFGVDEESLDEVLDPLLASDAVEFRGLHLYIGTQILDSAILVGQYAHGLEIARRVAKRTGRPLAMLDFGGGLGVPYFSHEHELDMEALRAGLAKLFADVERDSAFSGTKFMVEPGRYLVGEAGVYVARVTDIKISRGKKFLIGDGGMHHHLAASGNLGQTIKRNYPVAILNKLDAPATETVDVAGPLCTPLDVLARGVQLPPAEVGDLIGVFQSGAYARAASPLGFLSHPSPLEVWIEGGESRLIRRRGEYQDYLNDQPVATVANLRSAR
ncbi:MAG: type III PLP-dependent enzyme [Candidatus Acidiferrales bacterium]